MPRRNGWTLACCNLAAVLTATGCARADAKPYSGVWQRGAAEAGMTLTITPTGRIELRQSQPARASDSLMKGPAVFHGDTLSFVGAPCEPREARYLAALAGTTLTITGLGEDGCVTRRKTLSGTWARQ